MGTFSRLVLVLLALLSFSLTPPPAPAAEWRDVTDDRPANAGSDPANWLLYSRTDNSWRESPLDHNKTRNNKKHGAKRGFWGGVLGGFVKAFEAETGKSLGRWYPVPAAGEPGSETWQADTWKIGGGAVWHTGTYDPATNLLYVGTGNPAPWIADMRRGENLYTMSAVALDVDSGKMKWYHQYLANEPWDFDTMAQHHVIDVVREIGRAHV